MTKLLALCGSSRNGSFNQRALAVLADLARDADADVETIDLAGLALPIYNADLETKHGLPQGAHTLREKLSSANGLMVGCPEYNGFITPLLLNAIDWATRSAEARPDLSPFANKVALISSASPGGFGGMRAAGHLRTLLSGIGCIVLPQGFVLPSAAQGFSEDGKFAADAMNKRAVQVVKALIDLSAKLK